MFAKLVLLFFILFFYSLYFLFFINQLIAAKIVNGKNTRDNVRPPLVYFSQKQPPRKLKTRLVIIECAGHIFWQLFLWQL